MKTISKVEIYDIESKSHKVVKVFPYLIEAPNWSPDGKWLIFNSEGKLYRMAADGSDEPILIESGFAQLCNNDHVI
ncbi:MAG: transporter, partial [Paludibacteraceae bacterium]|nr:transporter [Paludibacteraceae bacterium]